MKKRWRPQEQVRHAIMRRRGVPDALLDGVQRWGRDGRRKRIRTESVWIAVGIATVGILLISMLRWFDSSVLSYAIQIGRQTDAWLVKADSQTGGFSVLFSLLPLAGWLFARFEKPEQALLATADMLRTKHWAPSWYVRPITRKVGAYTLDVERFLRDVRARHMRRSGILVGALVAFAATTMIAETRHIVIAGHSGLVSHQLFPPFTQRAYRWDETTRVRLKCVNRASGRRSIGHPSLSYKIRFGDWTSFDLGNGRGIYAPTNAQLKKIDALMPAGAEYIVESSRWRCKDFERLRRNSILQFTASSE